MIKQIFHGALRRGVILMTTHLSYSITELKINPFEYKLLFTSTPIARVRNVAFNNSSFVILQRDSLYRLDLTENPPNDLTFVVSLSMVIDQLAKICKINVHWNMSLYLYGDGFKKQICRKWCLSLNDHRQYL